MKIFTFILFCISIPLIGFSQEQEKIKENQKRETAEEISTEFSIPSIPALSFISSDITDISRPSNVKKFASSLYNGIDENGKVKQGLAIEVKPSEILKISITPDEYRSNALKYVIYNTQLSLGTVATSGDSTSTDLGWGLRITLFDNSDPMTDEDFINEFEHALLKCGPSHPDSLITDEQFRSCLKNSARPIGDSFKSKNWNSSWLMISYAGGTRLKGSDISEGQNLGHNVWITGGNPIKTWGQFSYLIKWSEEYNEMVDARMNELKIGGKLLVGNATYNVFLEASYNPLLNDEDFKGDNMVKSNDNFSWSGGLEFKVSNGVWAIAAIGEDPERIVGSDGLQLLTGIKFGISDKSRLKYK